MSIAPFFSFVNRFFKIFQKIIRRGFRSCGNTKQSVAGGNDFTAFLNPGKITAFLKKLLDKHGT